MANEHLYARDVVTVGLRASARIVEEVQLQDGFTIECYNAEGHLVWREDTSRDVVDASRAQERR